MDETVVVDQRRHGIVLVRPLARSLLLVLLGVAGFALGWPASLPGVVLLAAGAGYAFAAVLSWDRTHVVLTTEKLFVEHGIVRRRAAAVRLAKVSTVELEQSPLGRLLGYGTLVAGELEIGAVPRARDVAGLVERLAG